jgi:MoaA/NifB/PqqE/SkfB family radical SAM enzyme
MYILNILLKLKYGMNVEILIMLIASGRLGRMFTPVNNLCPEPWQRMVVGISGIVVPCCYRPWPEAFGNLKTQTWEEIWNGKSYQELRLLMKLRGHQGACPDCQIRDTNGLPGTAVKYDLLNNGSAYARNAKKFLKEFSEGVAILTAKCSSLTLSPSGKCNLHCIQCAQREAHFYREEIGENSLAAMHNLLPYLGTLGLGGGEPMIMAEYQECLAAAAEHNHLTFTLITNGLLLDECQLRQIINFHSANIAISIDAGTKDIYDKLRGGNWDRLYNNLLSASKIRKIKKNIFFSGSYTINKINILDLCNYIKMCIELRLPSSFYYVWHYPPDLRPDLFCDAEKETAGWLEEIDNALILARKFDDAQYEESFCDGVQYQMTPFLNKYLGIIKEAMLKSRGYGEYRSSLRPALGNKFILAVDTAAGQPVAYGYSDQSGKIYLRLPARTNLCLCAYDDRYMYSLLKSWPIGIGSKWKYLRHRFVTSLPYRAFRKIAGIVHMAKR